MKFENELVPRRRRKRWQVIMVDLMLSQEEEVTPFPQRGKNDLKIHLSVVK